MSISPSGWGLSPSVEKNHPYLSRLNIPQPDQPDLEERARRNTYDWLLGQYMDDAGAFPGHYDASNNSYSPPQTANLIAPFQLLAAYDRYQDEKLLDMVKRCSHWLNENMVETHPMSLILGGVRDNVKTRQLWTKYTADYVTLNLGIYDRSKDEEFLRRALQGSNFLLQSQSHSFAPKYNDWDETWVEKGWQSFGRVVVALIALHEFTGDEEWLDRGCQWGEYGLGLQSNNGCFYLLNDDYYNSDIAADEIRALIRLYWRTGRKKFLDSATRFADWHLGNQLDNGAWPLTLDRWGIAVGDYTGPGDVPNIAISLLMCHQATSDIKYLVSGVKALKYSMSRQVIPGKPYSEDPNACWGFWSWDPPYDYTMSSDQSTHHVRGYWFFLDYFHSLEEETKTELVEIEEQA
jgi:hypothetical protein